MSKDNTTDFANIELGEEFRRDGSRWRREDFPSGHNARCLEPEETRIAFSKHFKDWQQVRPAKRSKGTNV